MKKKNVQSLKLQLNKTVIYPLTNDQLLAVRGGAATEKKEPKEPIDPKDPKQPHPSGNDCTNVPSRRNYIYNDNPA